MVQSTFKYDDQAQIQALQDILCERLDELVALLTPELTRTHKMFIGACPIHEGDNTSALNLYSSGDIPGKWMCRTRHCEETFRKTLIGFIRGVLSHQQYGWTKSGDKTVSFREALAWCSTFIGQDYRKLPVDMGAHNKKLFLRQSRVINPWGTERTGWSREFVRSRLDIPADYFVRRGFSREILDRYDVGLCRNSAKPFSNRIVVPVYDNKGNGTGLSAIGFTARSIHEQCPKCKLWHAPAQQEATCACPPPEQAKLYSKWRNSDGFHRESHLYNLANAKGAISKTGTAIIVEGSGEIWRLEEAGFPNGVGLLGTSLTDPQEILLEPFMRSTIIATNGDQAGRNAAETIRKQLCKRYRTYVLKWPEGLNDFGDAKAEDVRSIVGPLIEAAKCNFYLG